MKNYFTHILGGFDFASITEFFHSLIPTVKYNLPLLMVFVSLPLATIDAIFGLNAAAVAGLLVVMILELSSGIFASHISKQEFSSRKLSRFTFKVACYLVLIAVPYLFHRSFEEHNNKMASSVFDWLHTFLTIQIVVENILSIVENIAVIQGKPKTYWVDKIKSKIDSML